jgi:hypothetical protein
MGDMERGRGTCGTAHLAAETEDGVVEYKAVQNRIATLSHFVHLRNFVQIRTEFFPPAQTLSFVGYFVLK